MHMTSTGRNRGGRRTCNGLVAVAAVVFFAAKTEHDISMEVSLQLKHKFGWSVSPFCVATTFFAEGRALVASVLWK